MKDENELKQLVNDYFKAFEAKDLSRCLEFFVDEAVLHFATGRFPKKKGIEQWHKDRFKGGMRIVEIESVDVENDTVTVQAVVTSPKLKLVRVADLRGTATFVFEQDKIKVLKMGLRKGYRFHI